MGQQIARVLSGVTVALVVVGAPGCSRQVRQAALEAVASEMTPPNDRVVEKLETSANPTGEGVLVFVRASDCEPKYAWLWLNGHSPAFAMDATSQALTPRLKTVDEAPANIWSRIGSEPKKYQLEVRAAVCRDKR